MDILTYSLLTIASFLGLYFGILLSSMCVEEIDGVSRYKRYIISILVSAMIFCTFDKISLIQAIIATAVTFTLMMIIKDKDRIIYPITGILLCISTIFGNPSYTAILIFIYGILLSTFEASRQFKKKVNGEVENKETWNLARRIFFRYLYFIPVSFIAHCVLTYLL